MVSKSLISLLSCLCLLEVARAQGIQPDSEISFCDVNDAACNTASISFQVSTDSFNDDFIQMHKDSFECHTDSYKFKQFESVDSESEGLSGKWLNNEHTIVQKASSIVLSEDQNVFNVICELPNSDVHHSLHPELSRSSHNNPLAFNGVSISSFIVKLIANSSDSNYVSVKYLVLFDGKCRNCEQNDNRLKRSNSLLSVECKIKENTCENNGLCYLQGEVSHNMIGLDGKPVLNAFVCAPHISRRSLYMPCAKQNGGCKYESICNFNATTLQVSCMN